MEIKLNFKILRMKIKQKVKASKQQHSNKEKQNKKALMQKYKKQKQKTTLYTLALPLLTATRAILPKSAWTPSWRSSPRIAAEEGERQGRAASADRPGRCWKSFQVTTFLTRFGYLL